MHPLREDAVKAIQAQVSNLAGIRQCSGVDAARSIAASMSTALSTARGTRDEPYWRLMVDVSEQEVVKQLSSRDQPEPRYTP